jgi:hypothetical protein
MKKERKYCKCFMKIERKKNEKGFTYEKEKMNEQRQKMNEIFAV